MIKKFLLGLCFLSFLSINPVYSHTSAIISESELKEVQTFFDSYVNSANNYEDNLIELYTPNATIERVVLQPNGNKETVKIPMARYIQELKKGRKVAKLVNYKNRYINKKFEKLSDSEYIVKTKRIPFKDKTGLNAEFTIKRTPSGLKISHESMETTVQKFLNEK